MKRNIQTEIIKSDKEGIEILVAYIANEFLGEEWIRNFEDEAKREKDYARIKLINLTICDMCKIKEYTCEFKNYYYIQFYSNENQEVYLDMYYTKLPGT